MTPAAVRQQVSDALAQLGLVEIELQYETILVRDGFYIGRRFEFGVVQAIWSAESGTVRIFADGAKPIAEIGAEKRICVAA